MIPAFEWLSVDTWKQLLARLKESVSVNKRKLFIYVHKSRANELGAPVPYDWSFLKEKSYQNCG